jgi:hypothetical protein
MWLTVYRMVVRYESSLVTGISRVLIEARIPSVLMKTADDNSMLLIHICIYKCELFSQWQLHTDREQTVPILRQRVSIKRRRSCLTWLDAVSTAEVTWWSRSLSFNIREGWTCLSQDNVTKLRCKGWRKPRDTCIIQREVCKGYIPNENEMYLVCIRSRKFNQPYRKKLLQNHHRGTLVNKC